MFFLLTHLFLWLFGVWWVGEIHLRRVLCIHMHWFHLWHISLLKIRMSSEEELTVGEEENPMHQHLWSFAIVSWVISNTTKRIIQLIGVSNGCGRCTRVEDFLIEMVRWRKNMLCVSVPVLAFLEATVCVGPTDIQTLDTRCSSVDAIQMCT